MNTVINVTPIRNANHAFQLNGGGTNGTGMTMFQAPSEFPAPPTIYGQFEAKPGSMVPTASPIKNQSLWTNTVVSNISNVNPLTYRQINAEGSIPYGMARGQISMLSQLNINRPGKPLEVNNERIFDQVAFDKVGYVVQPSMYGKD